MTAPQLEHSDYPHEPGALYDCAACEAECFCGPGSATCVHCAIRRERDWLTIEICTDCACLIANGEATDSDGNDIAPALAERIIERWDGVQRLVVGSDEEEWFSWSPCEACGDTLGGNRLTAYARWDDPCLTPEQTRPANMQHYPMRED